MLEKEKGQEDFFKHLKVKIFFKKGKKEHLRKKEGDLLLIREDKES